jgi:hypothetical protein
MRWSAISATTYTHQRGDQAVYVVAIDFNGEAWFYDTGAPSPQWQRLPSHPAGRPPTSGSAP